MSNEKPATPPPPSPASHTAECGKDALGRFVERTTHACSGLRVAVDRCPDATLSRAIGFGSVAAALGWGAAFLLRATPHGRFVATIGSAIGGVVASRYHVSADWDPDRAFR